uniref:Reverse transcriptase domain-containing protein n=1 Tax=Mycena chlorophos TaxID=658473 RepID=A0ABQ0LAH9_MYCCL|nr:predicted protein [Mycena chlorophos]
MLDEADETVSCYLPQSMRGMGWRHHEPASYSRTARYTEIDEPLPQPSEYEFKNASAVGTIRDNPDLFQVPQVIRVGRLESLLQRHPNQALVQSVVTGLREGFWPWVNTRHDDGYPTTWDNSWAPPPDERARDFIASQRDTEVKKNRFSRTFGPDLKPGMYSTPIFAVPKPHSDALRLVSHQSCGLFAQNTMIDQAQTKGPRMDTMQQFIPALLRFRRQNPNARIVLWKSDVSEAFRLLPMHPLMQIKQVATSNIPTKDEVAAGRDNGPLQRNVDWCATFGSGGSPRLWATVMGLVIWIAIFVEWLSDLFCYVDDSYSWELESNFLHYAPYDKRMPAKQVKLLQLWDHLGIPHKESKQLHGETLTIIGFELNANKMTMSLPASSRTDLISAVNDFITSRQRTLHEFQSLVGWINWSYNMYFLLRPALSNVYAKMAGKSKQHAPIYINNDIRDDLRWFVNYLERSDGTLLLDALDWNPHTEAHATIYCDASLGGMGFWVLGHLLGFHAPVPSEPPASTIFYFEALCVASALRWYCTNVLASSSTTSRYRLTIFTDNQNTVNIFSSLRASPAYNKILRSAVDDLIAFNVDLRVLHVKGELNSVADALSRNKLDVARQLAPGLVINPQPARPPWTIEQLDSALAVALNASIDISSAHTYGSALNSWIEFCRIHNFDTEPTEKTLAYFVVYRSSHISPNSVDSYLSGICNQLEPIFPRVREIRKSLLVSRALKGSKRIHGRPVKRKDPLTIAHLNHAIANLPTVPTHDDRLFLAMLLSGFRALHRLGELTMPDNPQLRNPRKYTKRESVTVNDDSYEYWLPAHKADTAFEGNRIIITDPTALAHFRLYLASRDTTLPFNPYLWAREDGQVPVRAWFIRRLRHLVPNTNIAGQSLRAGGATALAEDGALPHIIQAAGRWSSDAFYVYLRKHPMLLHALLRAGGAGTRTSPS